MHRAHLPLFATLAIAPVALIAPLNAQVRGERIPDAAISPLVLESMDVVRARAAQFPDPRPTLFEGQPGRWFVPPETAKTPTHSGTRAIVNEWGDPRMSIGFARAVDVLDLWVAGHGSAPAHAVRFSGIAGGKVVATSKWFPLGTTHSKISLDMQGVERLVIEAQPFVDGRGYFALDDLRYRVDDRVVALDFDDLHARDILTKTQYAGLTWDFGTGFQHQIESSDIVPAPREPILEAGGETEITPLAAAGGTTPSTWDDFIGVTQGDPGATYIPPDTCGCSGPNHFISITNSNLSAWTKTTKTRVVNTSLGAFWGASGTVGDPRAVWDSHAGRYIILATDFSRTKTFFYAISATTDPAGSWYKFSFQTNQGTDATRWPDYPTLGVDSRGIYSAAYMVTGSARMTIWAIDKAPLLANPPSVGTITAFRSLPWEGAIQPCTTYGDPGGEYLVSRRSSSSLRVRRVNGPLSAPTLSEIGLVSIPSHSSAPNAPALGSSTNISTLDTRPQNAVFRNGSLWTAHEINVNGRAGFRWYEIGVSPLTLKQYGTVGDSLWHYYYPAIAVDAKGNVGIGFSGSHAGVYCSAFLTGRRASDPAGMTADPVFVKAGEAAWNRLDGSGRNRFGDYSHINVDPVDDVGFWSIQEYIWQTNTWRTRITRFGYDAFSFGDGLAGKNRIPTLRATTRPAIGQSTNLEVQNSTGALTAGLVVIGLARIDVSILGGTLYPSPDVLVTLAISPPSVNVGLPIPNDNNFIGKPIYLQSVQLDAAAAQSWSFSAGLQIEAGTR
ncbi:MAG: hypothetical protein KDC95_09665 [Planctomycetes bacterium]|nr:hypothetical protein [Planctomycetota bacterium]